MREMDDEPRRFVSLVTRRPDPYAQVRERAIAYVEEHPGTPAIPAYAEARMLATLTRALRSTYVLLLGAGGGYTALHISSSFGHTGQLDVVETDPKFAGIAEAAAARFAMADRIRVHTGTVRDVVSSLNGPFDLVVLWAAAADREWPALHPDLVRLVRVGGSIVVSGLPPAMGAGEGRDPLAEYMVQLAQDERLLLGVAGESGLAIAARVR
ncbi:MAG: O-methyltransferase [Dehalococcoidia bacterium]